MTEYLLPSKILEYKDITNVESLYEKKHMLSVFQSDQSVWPTYAKMEGRDSYIIIDFGKEMNGGIRLFTGLIYKSTCLVRIRFGESLAEVNSSIGEKNATNDHGPRDFEYIITTFADLNIGDTGFRFVRIDLLEDKFIYLRNIYCVNKIFKAKQIYDYKGNDKRIKDIFEAAKRTIDLCTATGYIWDGIKRDRLVWIGDCAPEVMALSTLYGDVRPIRRSLDAGETAFGFHRFMNNISTYSMWWIIILHDYYKEFGCKKYVESKLDNLVEFVDLFDKLMDEDGNISPNYRHLVDWPTVGSVDEEPGVRLIFLMGADKLISLFKEFGIDAARVEDIKRRIMIKPFDIKEKKQVIGLKYEALGKISDEEYETLVKDGPKGFSTFMSYYILTAIASRDEKLAIDLMKEYYGAMLDKGATTFFEDFDIDWAANSCSLTEMPKEGERDIHGDFGKHCYIGYRHSLCHGWSTGVIKFIKEHCR